MFVSVGAWISSVAVMVSVLVLVWSGALGVAARVVGAAAAVLLSGVPCSVVAVAGAGTESRGVVASANVVLLTRVWVISGVRSELFAGIAMAVGAWGTVSVTGVGSTEGGSVGVLSGVELLVACGDTCSRRLAILVVGRGHSVRIPVGRMLSVVRGEEPDGPLLAVASPAGGMLTVGVLLAQPMGGGVFSFSRDIR